MLSVQLIIECAVRKLSLGSVFSTSYMYMCTFCTNICLIRSSLVCISWRCSWRFCSYVSWRLWRGRGREGAGQGAVRGEQGVRMGGGEKDWACELCCILHYASTELHLLCTVALSHLMGLLSAFMSTKPISCSLLRR